MDDFWAEPTRGFGLTGSALTLALAVVVPAASGNASRLAGVPEWLYYLAIAVAVGMNLVGCVAACVAVRRPRLGAFLLLAAALGGPGGVLAVLALPRAATLAREPDMGGFLLILGLLLWWPLILGLLAATALMLIASRLSIQDARTAARA
jgi:hypothetical protein